ncbi:hypothetical protein P7C73_g6836, partial [Tremellales sp. Uapishka_1]
MDGIPTESARIEFKPQVAFLYFSRFPMQPPCSSPMFPFARPLTPDEEQELHLDRLSPQSPVSDPTFYPQTPAPSPCSPLCRPKSKRWKRSRPPETPLISCSATSAKLLTSDRDRDVGGRMPVADWTPVIRGIQRIRRPAVLHHHTDDHYYRYHLFPLIPSQRHHKMAPADEITSRGTNDQVSRASLLRSSLQRTLLTASSRQGNSYDTRADASGNTATAIPSGSLSPDARASSTDSFGQYRRVVLLQEHRQLDLLQLG